MRRYDIDAFGEEGQERRGGVRDCRDDEVVRRFRDRADYREGKRTT